MKEFRQFIYLMVSLVLGMIAVYILGSRPLVAQSSVISIGGKQFVKLNSPLAQTPICLVSYVDVRACFGAYGDYRFALGAMASGSKTITIPLAHFTAADVGKVIEVFGAGISSAILVSTISAYTSPTVVTLAKAASTTQSSTYVNWGHDDTAAINASIKAACGASPIGSVYFPIGEYFVSGLTPISAACSGVTLFGANEYLSGIVGRQSTTEDILTLNAVSGSPTEIHDLSVRGAYGGLTGSNCLAVTNSNGVRLSNLWIAGCNRNIAVNGGSDVRIDQVTSELSYDSNFYFTNIALFQLTNSESYQSQNIGFNFSEGPASTIGGANAGRAIVANSYDTESINQSWNVLLYSDISFSNVASITSNNQRPVTGFYIQDASRLLFQNASAQHGKNIGIHLLTSNSDIKFSNTIIDQVGNYGTLPAGVLVGVQVDSGNTNISFEGGTISNIPGTCMSFAGSGHVVDMSFDNCASANNSEAGLYGLYLDPGSASTLAQLVSGNQFLNTGYTYGTAIYVLNGANERFIGNDILGGYATPYTNAGGTASGNYNSFTP